MSKVFKLTVIELNIDKKESASPASIVVINAQAFAEKIFSKLSSSFEKIFIHSP